MRNDKLLLVAVIAASVTLAAGCSREHLRKDFGNATAVNTASQVVNPQAADQAPATNTVDGQKVEKGLTRYRNDKAESTRAKLMSDLGN